MERIINYKLNLRFALIKANLSKSMLVIRGIEKRSQVYVTIAFKVRLKAQSMGEHRARDGKQRIQRA